MNKELIINTEKFNKKRKEYGLLGQNYKIYNNVIVHETSMPSVHVLFDENYNTIGIHQANYKKGKITKEELATSYYQKYCEVEESKASRLPFPFQNYSMKEMMNLFNITEEDNIYSIVINSGLEDEKNYDTYFQLLSYAKLLGKEIDNYYLNKYSMIMLGFEYPDIYAYLKKFAGSLNYAIIRQVTSSKDPLPIVVFEELGKDKGCMDKYLELIQHVIYLVEEEMSLNQGYPKFDVKEYFTSLADNLHVLLEDKKCTKVKKRG